VSFIEGALGSVAGSEATAPKKGTTGKGLTAKWHGIPMWALYGGALVGGYLLYRYYENQKAASAANAANALTDTGTTAPDTGTGAGSGGGSGSGGQNPWSWLTGNGGFSDAGTTSPTTTVGATTPAAGGGSSVISPLNAVNPGGLNISTPNPTPSSPSSLAAVTLANAQQALSQAQTPAQVQAAQPAVNAAVSAANAAGPAAVANVQSVVAANSTGSVNTIGSQYGTAQTAATATQSLNPTTAAPLSSLGQDQPAQAPAPSEAAAQKVVTTPSGAKAQTAVLQPANADASKAVAF
jgi:hypothetical protein